jgi:NitT/TauT family transport system ATP-binding protein
MAHIEARDITLTYQTPSGAAPAVYGVSFGIETSEFLCIVGPSGCGKSTLLNIVAGFLSPTAGEIRIAGAPVKGYGTDRGVVFQDFAQLFPWRTALGNVAFGLEMKRVPKAEREAIAREQLRLVKLENFARSYPHHLSGGMQQRVAIARSLAYSPAVLLMDEPFAALDALTRNEMQRLLADVWRTTRKTIIYVTHNVAEGLSCRSRAGDDGASGHGQNRSDDSTAAPARSAQCRVSRLSKGAVAFVGSRSGSRKRTTKRTQKRRSCAQRAGTEPINRK